MKGPCCAICKVGSINCDGNGWNPFKNSLTCCWITSTASSTTAAPRYASEWWKPSTATSKPFLEGAAAARISAIYYSRPNAWRSPRPNSSFFRKQPKIRLSTNSCTERHQPQLLLDGCGLLELLPHIWKIRAEFVKISGHVWTGIPTTNTRLHLFHSNTAVVKGTLARNRSS